MLLTACGAQHADLRLSQILIVPAVSNMLPSLASRRADHTPKLFAVLVSNLSRGVSLISSSVLTLIQVSFHFRTSFFARRVWLGAPIPTSRLGYHTHIRIFHISWSSVSPVGRHSGE